MNIPLTESRGGAIGSDVVQKKIDAIGFGWFHVMVLFLVGGVVFSEGSQMLVMGSITTILKDHWDLSPFARAMMVSIVFVGFGVGNLLSGFIGDRYGRRPSILLGYCLISVSGLLSATVNGAYLMITLRFLVGCGCGIAFPSLFALVSEMSPAHLRGTQIGLTVGFMALGEIFAASVVLIVDPYLQGLESKCTVPFEPTLVRAVDHAIDGKTFSWGCTWRHLCELSAVPAFFFLIFAYFYLPESPVFLAVRGRHAEARRVIYRMAKMNGKIEIASEFEPDNDDEEIVSTSVTTLTGRSTNAFQFGGSVVKLLFSSTYASTTLCLFLAHFCKDFGVFGLAYVFPQFFLATTSNMSPGLEILITALLALPGVALALLLASNDRIGQLTAIPMTASICAICAFGMLSFEPHWLSSPAAYLLKFSALAFFVSVNTYIAEIFPNSCRNLAMGSCGAFGKLGSISAPIIFEWSRAAHGGFDVFIWVFFGFMVAVAVVSKFALKYETKNKPLVDGMFGEGKGDLETSYGSISVDGCDVPRAG